MLMRKFFIMYFYPFARHINTDTQHIYRYDKTLIYAFFLHRPLPLYILLNLHPLIFRFTVLSQVYFPLFFLFCKIVIFHLCPLFQKHKYSVELGLGVL